MNRIRNLMHLRTLARALERSDNTTSLLFLCAQHSNCTVHSGRIQSREKRINGTVECCADAGDRLVEWNGVQLSGLTRSEVDQIIRDATPSTEVEIAIKW